MKNIVRIFFSMVLTGQLFAQSPLQINCPGNLPVCDLTPNDASLWNETYWHDPQHNVQDLSEGPTDLNILVTDTCASVSIRYLLFLDLNQDSTMETVIDSDNLPGYNTVPFDNALHPNYTGGTARTFDERTVGANEKYGFALQITGTGNDRTAALRWNTQQAPGIYTIPQLPYGNHKIKWIVSDVCGHESSCEYNFIVKDCKPPTITCLNGAVVIITPTTQIDVLPANLLWYAMDNISPTALLDFAVRQSGTGAGFPVDSMTGEPLAKVTFDCSEPGVQIIELWARDVAGNVDFCETYVIVMDTLHYCPTQLQQVTTCVNFWKDGSPIKLDLDFDPLAHSSSYDSLGCLVVMLNAPIGSMLTVTPVLESDPLNGVNTLDLIRISRHILGSVPLGSPYAVIAADANKSGSITSFDLLELKKLLLGVYPELPNNTSWRFVEAGFQFPNPNDPFQTVLPESAIAVSVDSIAHFAFVGLKTGDVDGDAYPGFGAPAEDRAAAVITLPDVRLLPGETMELPLRMQTAGEWLGLQMQLRFDPALLEVEIENSAQLPGWDASAWAIPRPGVLRLAWFDVKPQIWLPDENVLTVRVRALAPVRVREVLGLSPAAAQAGLAAAAVSAANEIRPLQLAFTPPVASAGATTIFAPQPNPVNDSGINIPLQLHQPEIVRLQVTDLTGRMLFQSEQMLDEGGHLLPIPANTFPRIGVYVWRIQAGNAVASGKVVKNK